MGTYLSRQTSYTMTHENPSGKGSPKYWVAVVKLGRILYEMSGVAENIAQKAISIATSKMPIRTQFIISG
ncbi:hypothetical protein CUMW_282900 [Citrus unshiu]|uniref:Uncharacterized protein n=1 Tax=Citrus unshiu TaxID=55188 RepID=A0A2H5N3X0_CITUN|nr:hypothetical protein CUMW_282900 [Citrus unshiu]